MNALRAAALAAAITLGIAIVLLSLIVWAVGAKDEIKPQTSVVVVLGVICVMVPMATFLGVWAITG
jgi:hypothetical protein